MEGFEINIPKEYEWDIVENEQMGSLIDDALKPYHQMFMQLMEREHIRFYNNIHDRLDDARARCDEYTERIQDLCALNVGDEVTPEIRSIEKSRRPLLTIVRSAAAEFGRQEDYIAHMQTKFDEDLHRHTAALGMRCINEGYDMGRLAVTCVSVKDNGLVLDFDAGEGKGFEALFSYSKGSSLLRTPHLRCIVSDRSMQYEQEVAPVITQGTTGENLNERIVRTLQNVSPELCDIYIYAQRTYYRNLWDKLPYARERYEALQKEIATAGRMGKSAEAKRLRKVANGFGHLTNSEAARHLTVDSYIHHVRAGWDECLERTASSLAQKCIDKGMDDKRTKIMEMKFSGNTLEITLTDGTGEIRSACMMHGDKGVQHPPQIKTSVGELKRLELKQDSPTIEKLPELKDVQKDNPVLDIPDGLITKAKIVKYAEKLYITCYIAGERQSPQRIRPEEWKRYIEQSGNDKTGLVTAHFADKIQQALSGDTWEMGLSGYRRN